jgi:peptidoglycan/xylan/chitin deacetylase (PgdA/CDA1 family)
LARRITTLAARGAELSGFIRLLEILEPDRLNRLRVLTYHRIGDPSSQPEQYPGLFSATPEDFDSQLAHLTRRYRPVSIARVLEARRGGRPLPPRAVLVTFDDGYRDFAELAWPALRRHGVPATLFVPTAFPDQPQRAFWWDRLYHAVTATRRREPLETAQSGKAGRLPLATPDERLRTFRRLQGLVKSLPHDEATHLVAEVCDQLGESAHQTDVLGWNELRVLARAGVTLGAHTRTHPLMTQIAVTQMRDEVVGSLRDLEREIGSALSVFAYPSGAFDDRAVDVLESEGFELAFTTLRGVNDLRRDHPLRLRRINVGMRTTLAAQRAQLLATTGWVQRWRLPTGSRQESGATEA